MSVYGSPGIPMMAPQQGGGITQVPFQQPQQLFRYGEQSIWSSQLFLPTVAIASSSYRLFSTALGQSGQGFTPMSLAETSLKIGGQIPAGVAFDCFGISCHIFHGNAAGTAFNVPTDNATLIGNLVNFQNNGVLAWDFQQTTVEISPLHMVGAGGGAFGSVSQNAAGANSGAMNNGAGSVWMYRKHAVALPGQAPFSLLLRFGNYAAAIAAGNSVVAKISLLGYYKSVLAIG